MLRRKLALDQRPHRAWQAHWQAFRKGAPSWHCDRAAVAVAASRDGHWVVKELLYRDEATVNESFREDSIMLRKK